jgi:hypothetical protein
MSYVCMIRVFDPSYVSVVVHPLSFLQYLASVSRIVSRYERSNINYMVQIDLIISSISWAYMHLDTQNLLGNFEFK